MVSPGIARGCHEARQAFVGWYQSAKTNKTWMLDWRRWMVKTFIGWAVLLFPAALFAANYGSIMLDKENVLGVTDGQTFQVDIHQWQSVVGRNIEVRLRGVETPAIDGECDQESALAVDARNFVHKLLMSAETIVLRDIDRDQGAFRLVADVTVDGIELGAAVLEAELGRPSDDAKEQVWCDMQVSEMAYQDGTYSGEVLDGIPDGVGTWISPYGQQYVGQWQDGLWHGEGNAECCRWIYEYRRVPEWPAQWPKHLDSPRWQ